VAPSQAFEVFAGKAYPTSAARFSDAVTVASQATELTIVGTPNATPGEKETPLQRLLRLQHEAKELALEVGASQDKSDTAEDFPANIASEAEALQRQLEALLAPASSANAGFDPSVEASKALRVQADLTSRMMQAASKGSESTAEQGASVGAVYELFVTPLAGADATAAQLKGAELEQRLAVVESAMGMEASAGSASLSEKLEKMEAKVELIDAAKLESVGRKATTLATHLSALLKQKKQVAPSSDQEKMIEELHRTLQKWDGVATSLPSVVARLHALKTLQDSSLTVAATVEKMEEAHAVLTQEIKDQGGNISSVQQSFESNAQQISANIAALEERIQKVAAQTK